MPIDTSMYNALKPVQIESPLDNYAKVAQVQQAQNQNRLADLTLQQHQRSLDADNKLASLLAQNLKPEDVQAGLAGAGYGSQALAYRKQLQDQAKQQADVEHLNAQTAETKGKTSAADYDLRLKKSNKAINDIASFDSLDQARASLEAHYKAGDLDEAKYQGVLQTMPQDPKQFRAWQLNMIKGIMDAKDRMKFETPDANAQLQSATSLKTTAMNNATSRANNAATIAAENARAGVVPGGGLDANSERTAQAIASGQLPAPTGMALLNPKNQRILGRVMEINPNYDYTDVAAKRKAAADFTTGTLGNSMRSFAVAGQHLDQLGQLVDAMDNGNHQLLNKIANAYSQQTGSPAVTNFDAAKDVVSKEVIKAIVAGGGGVSEREELSKLMSSAKSPAQLKGVIQQYRNLMAAQHDALLQQRRAAGLKDSTMPNYGETPKVENAGLHAQAEAIIRGGK